MRISNISKLGHCRTIVALAIVILLAAIAGLPASAQRGRIAPEGASGHYAKTASRADKFMVAAANPLAVEAGLSMLRQGGSAVDAAIAVQLVLNLVEPQSSGIGGGAFLLHWDSARKKLRSYDGRETAPAAARPDRFLENGRRRPFRKVVKSGLSVGVPGLVRLLELVHQRHGRLDWQDLFEPAIRLAEEGFRVSPRLNFLLKWAARPDTFAPIARAYFYGLDGTPIPVGYRLRNPEFAATLRAIAAGGADAFYRGDIAAQLVRAVRMAVPYKGDLSADDLAGYQAKERQPVCADYRDVKVCGMGPPSSGALTVAQILKLAERHTSKGTSTRPMNTRALHILGEAGRLAFADRNRYIADPDFVTVPNLLEPNYLTMRARLIRPDRAARKVTAGVPPTARADAFGKDDTRERAGTSHLSVVDAQGNVVSMTTTIEGAFGSGLWAAGFLLNNELTDFSFLPNDREGRPIANRVEAGKRPRSSMAPTIVFNRDGTFRAALGSPGGSRIILYVAKTIVAMVDWRLDPQSAAASANFGNRGRYYEIEYNPALATDTPLSLWPSVPSVWYGIRMRALGHPVRPDLMASGIHIVARQSGGLIGGADPRREGVARGE